MARLLLLAVASFLLVPQSPKKLPIDAPSAGAIAGADRGDDHFKASWHAGRRKSLVEAIRAKKSASAPSGGVVVMRGAPPRRDYKRFRQTNEFFYVTGVEAPGAALVIDVESGKETLFLAAPSGGEGVWTDVLPHAPSKEAATQPATDGANRRSSGRRAAQAKGEEMAKKLGFDDIRDAKELPAMLESLKKRGTVYVNLAPEEYEAVSRDDAEEFEKRQESDPFDGQVSRNKKLGEKLTEKYGVEVKSLTPFLDQLRRIKTPEEIEAMRRASQIAAAGHIAAMRATKPGLKEWQIGNEATAIFYRMGAPDISYFPIVGTGKNANILHYTHTGAVVAPDDVILMDYAPEWRYYASDVTRSWPANGKFGEKGKKIYEAVLKAQEAAIAVVKPGAQFAAVLGAAAKVLQEEGFNPGRYMPHGLSHTIGMTTHDPDPLFGGTLQPGMVFTIEPGIYDAESGIGVRIEDVVAVTENGCDVLSKDAPKTVAEIEALVGKSAK